MRIVIVEDHLMFREVMRKVCHELGHEIVGEAGEGRQAVELTLKTDPELVLLDLHLPNLDGFAVVEALQEVRPQVRILVLSSHCDDYSVFRAERAHVHGFVDKNTSTVTSLKSAIAAVEAGRSYFSPAFRRIKAARHSDPNSFDKLLTDREKAVLALIGEPLTDREIAIRLGIANETAEKHRFNILRKLALPTTAALMRYAHQRGFTLAVRHGDTDAMLP